MKDDFYWTCFIHTGFLKCSVFLLRYSLQFRCINPVHHVSSRPSAIPCHSQTKIYRMMRMYILVLYIDKSRLNMHCHGCVILLKNHHSLIASKKETRLQSREFFHHFISIGRTKSRIYVVHYQTNLFMQCCLFLVISYTYLPSRNLILVVICIPLKAVQHAPDRGRPFPINILAGLSQ